jgi:dTMP kinase
MAISNQPGIFLVIEGVDGAGKTRVAKALVEALQADKEFMDANGYTGALYLREPGGTSFGDGMRQLILESAEPLAPMTEVLAFLASKSQLMEEAIKPAIYKGNVVVCDRYTRTLLAYQGELRGIPMQTLVNLLATSGILIPPNLELFLNVSVEVSAERRGKDINSFDTLARSRAEDLRTGYQKAVKALPRYRSVEINADGTFEEVFESVLKEVKRTMKLHRVAGLTLPQPVLSFTPEPDPVLIPIKSEVTASAVTGEEEPHVERSQDGNPTVGTALDPGTAYA